MGRRHQAQAGILFLLGALACTPHAESGRVGSSIATLSAQVAVVDSDDGSVSLLDPDTLAVTKTIAVGDEPRALLPLASGALLVTTHRGGEIARIDPASGQVEKQSPLCAGPFGLAAAPDDSYVVVACEWEGIVVRVDPQSLAMTTILTGLRRPRAVAVIGDDIFAAEFTGGDVVKLAADGTVTRTALRPEEAPYRPALTAMTVSQAAALWPSGDALHVAHMLVNNTGVAAGENVADDYGSVIDGNPKINPAVSSLVYHAGRSGSSGDLSAAEAPLLYARFEKGARVYSGPVALTGFASRYLLVAHVSTHNVAVLDTQATTPESRAVASYVVGAGPMGIAVDEAKNVAYVDNALDQSVSRIDLSLFKSANLAAYPAALTRTRPSTAQLSGEALAGRRLFYDASNVHVTPAGVVACSTCHPDGGEDGLVWFIHTNRIPLKRRRTPALAHSDAARLLHWDGAFTSLGALVQGTITDLMAGDALLVDFDSVGAYVKELLAAPHLPVRDEAARARGQMLFESSALGCASCHPGPSFSDQMLHSPLNPMSLSSDDQITAAKSPDLRGVFLRAPYFHDGRSPTLDDLLSRMDAKDHGAPATLGDADRADLIAYLMSL